MFASLFLPRFFPVRKLFIVAIYQPLLHPPESEVFYQQYRRQEQRLLLSNLPYIPRVNVVCTIIWFMVHVFGCCVFTKCGWANIFYSNLFFIQTRKWNIKKHKHKKVAATLKWVFVAKMSDPYGTFILHKHNLFSNWRQGYLVCTNLNFFILYSILNVIQKFAIHWI